MIAIFELGTLWFWTFIVAISIVVVTIQENSDSPGKWSTAWIIATFVALYYLGAGLNLKQLGLHIIHNPLETVVYFLMYTFLGTIWSFYEWKEVVSEAIKEYNKDIVNYAKYPNSYSRPNWNEYFYKNRRRPQLDEHKGEIFNWIFYWPFSVTWFVIHEPIERLFKFIMKKTKKIYEGITDKAFNKVKPPTDDMVHK